MKQVIVFLFGALLVVSFMLYMSVRKDAENERIMHDQMGIIRKIQEQRDSLLHDIDLIHDSLAQSYLILENQKRDTERARQQAQQAIRKYESTHFVSHSSDGARDSTLSRLYPSFRTVR